MGRLALYAGVSTALAAGVVASAFNQRANFYSACVYLQQSNLCLMVLINLILLIYSSLMYGLQRLCYGPLRPIEIEQLYEKGWFAVTETCLAMTIFREEVGPWFLVMFVALITGKVWGWIGDGRVEILEQQPPPNPRLFHFRLSVSLAISVIYDIWMMSYTINTVIQQARPNMMVMFLFEFTILTTSSVSTAIRYLISLHESRVIKKQTKERLAEQRREIREERAAIIRQREEAAAAGEERDAEAEEPLPSEDDIEEMDIEVPGWETKGQWILTLDLITDFAKLSIYLTFFFILLLFYGIPIHIMRDLFMTTRSFVKRLTAFLRYRRATQDMNKRYGDATVEDIEREDTCIICREQMRPWSVTNPPAAPDAPGDAQPPRPARRAVVNERSRPKKLPCGHILHLGCLKSWLERQQVCPTCRRPVVENAQAARNGTNLPQGQQAGRAPPDAAARRRMRVLRLGPFRVGFGQANLEDLAEIGRDQPAEDGAAQVYGLELGLGQRPRIGRERVQPRQPQQEQQQPPPPPQQQHHLPQQHAHHHPQQHHQNPEQRPRRQPQAVHQRHTDTGSQVTVQDQLQQIEQRIMAEIRGLHVMEQELQLVRVLQAELARLRLSQAGASDAMAANGMRQALPASLLNLQRHGGRAGGLPVPSGSSDLPPGVTIPEGWTLLPLQRLNGAVAGQPGTAPIPAARSAPPPSTTQRSSSPMPHISNIGRNPIPGANPEPESQRSSSNSDANVTNTPSSSSTGQPSSTVSHAPETTIRDNAPDASTATAFNTSGSSTLPNWGSSQLFSNQGQGTNEPSGHERPATGLAPSQDSGTADGGISSSLSRPVLEGESEARRREVGRAISATVEDTTDEAD